MEQKPSKILLTVETKNKTKLIPVPNVVGLSVSDAEKMLESAGFKVDVTEESEDSSNYEKLNLLQRKLQEEKGTQKKQVNQKVVQQKILTIHRHLVFMYRCLVQMLELKVV